MNDEERMNKMREDIIRALRERTSRADFEQTSKVHSTDSWEYFDSVYRPTHRPEDASHKETFTEHYRRILADWEPHCNEKSGEKFFIDLINLMCVKLRQRGLYVKLDNHDNERAVLLVSYDSPGAKEQTFILRNEDNTNYSWRKLNASWRNF